MTEIACPACGEAEELRGETGDDGVITITCESCEATFRRSERRCERCGSDDLYDAPVAVVEKSRGSQLSIVSTVTREFCWICDRDLIDAQRRSRRPLMPDELPTL